MIKLGVRVVRASISKLVLWPKPLLRTDFMTINNTVIEVNQEINVEQVIVEIIVNNEDFSHKEKKRSPIREGQIAEKKNSYDHFGKYIESLLRIIGFSTLTSKSTTQNQYSNSSVSSKYCSDIYSSSNELYL
ncbi:uncharacterized protein V1478_000394 [Vespula squamosa]|uniref:Uncharacterized protein n=1 Tax=Vespula squamosa TaxID=30214 RepID=A0ABD2C7F4_VESSQ